MPKLTKTMEEWIEKFKSNYIRYCDDGIFVQYCDDDNNDTDIDDFLVQAMQAAYAEGREDAIEEAAKIYNPYIEEHNPSYIEEHKPESNICPCCVFDEVIQSIQSLKQPKE